MEEEELEQEDFVELPFKRPSSRDGLKKPKGGEQKRGVEAKSAAQKPKAKAKSAGSKHELNFIEKITYPDGWEYAEIETAKGRRYKRYTSPKGGQHFSRCNAVGLGYDENNK